MENQGPGKVGEQVENAYKQIKGAIAQGLFPPGFQLVERDLAEQLSMSRTPIREAIKRLESDGFLERGKNRRIYVSFPNTEDLINNLYVREALEGMACRLAARNRTEQQLQELKLVVLQLEQVVQDNDSMKFYHLGEQVHQCIYQCCANPKLANLAKTVSAQTATTNYKNMLSLERNQTSTQEHLLIARCVLERDEDAAELAGRSHIQAIRSFVIENRPADGGLSPFSVAWKVQEL